MSSKEFPAVAAPRFAELTLAGQTAYAEVAERTRVFEMQRAIAGLPGGFHILRRGGRAYWYYSYRDPGAPRTHVIYVGPDTEEVRLVVERSVNEPAAEEPVAAARAAIQLGCAAMAPKHFRVVKRLAEYGLFHAGAVLVGAHAFVALGNVVGVRWRDAQATLDVDIAHAGRNLAVALPARLEVNVHGALESLRMGFLPMTELDGSIGTRYRSSQDQSMRVDFQTTFDRTGKAVKIPELNVATEPLRFMEFLLEDTTQGCILGARGSCIVNLPGAARLGVHKLVVYGERAPAERTKANKDLHQAAAVASYHLESDDAATFRAAWRDLIARGPGWKRRAGVGRNALLRIAPELNDRALW